MKGHIPSLEEASIVTQGKNLEAGLEDTEECCLLALLDSPESSAPWATPPTMDWILPYQSLI